MNRRAVTVAFCAGLIALALPAMAGADSNLDALQQQVERKLALAEARGTVSRHELIALRAQLDSIVKQKHALAEKTKNLSSAQRLAWQLQMMDRRLSAAENQPLASRWLRFF